MGFDSPLRFPDEGPGVRLPLALRFLAWLLPVAGVLLLASLPGRAAMVLRNAAEAARAAERLASAPSSEGATLLKSIVGHNLKHRYGCALYHAGKPYKQLATTKKPAVRRMMPGAWDLAFSYTGVA